MDINSYLHTSLSPYTLNSDAMRLITTLNENFSAEMEQKILILINAATLHPSMSRYQLSLTHKALGDCYYEHGYWGSALEQYNRALVYNKNLSVKRRINKIQSMPQEERKVSISPEIIDDVLQFPEYAKAVKNDLSERERMSDALWVGHEEEKVICDTIREEMVEDARLEDAILDPEHEAEIKRRLDALGEPYKTWFCKAREKRMLTRQSDDPLSMKDYDLMELQSMERVKMSSGV